MVSCSRGRAAGAAALPVASGATGLRTDAARAVTHSHCQPCLACTRNCFDFQPQLAQQADLHDPDTRWSQPRRLFAAALPGFVLGFFTVLGQPSLSTEEMYGRLTLYVLGSVGGFFALEAVVGHLGRDGHRPLGRGRDHGLLLVQLTDLRRGCVQPLRRGRPRLAPLAGPRDPCAPGPALAGADLLVGTPLPGGDRRGRGHRPRDAGRPTDDRDVRGSAGRGGRLRRWAERRTCRRRTERARARRGVRTRDRGRLPDGGLRLRPGGYSRRCRQPERAGGRGAQHLAPARTRTLDPDGLLRAGSRRLGPSQPHTGARYPRRRREAGRVRPFDHQRRGGRHRHRGRHRG